MGPIRGGADGAASRFAPPAMLAGHPHPGRRDSRPDAAPESYDALRFHGVQVQVRAAGATS